MATLYHFPRSLSCAAVQVVRELAAPVTVRTLGFENGQFVCPEEPALELPTGGMGLIGPVRSCPTYVEMAPDEALTLVQCSAIIDYICDRFGADSSLRPPPGTPARARHLSLMIFAEATLFPVVQFLSAEGSANDSPREEMRRARFQGLIAPFLLRELGGAAYMFGDSISACDFLIGMPCLNNAFNAGVLAPFPELGEYFERLRGRASFTEAHGDPGDDTLNRGLAAMVATAHRDQWDFGAPHER